jgi:hypothetical protein
MMGNFYRRLSSETVGGSFRKAMVGYLCGIPAGVIDWIKFVCACNGNTAALYSNTGPSR